MLAPDSVWVVGGMRDWRAPGDHGMAVKIGAIALHPGAVLRFSRIIGHVFGQAEELPFRAISGVTRSLLARQAERPAHWKHFRSDESPLTMVAESDFTGVQSGDLVGWTTMLRSSMICESGVSNGVETSAPGDSRSPVWPVCTSSSCRHRVVPQFPG